MSMRKAIYFLILLPSLALGWDGKVVGISDGDTLSIMHDGKAQKVRLVEVDAPESSQDFGQRSKQSLSDLCFGKKATVQDQGKDKYGRTLGRVSCAGVDANLEQVKRGMAWFYAQYGRDPAIKAAEDQARADSSGLWAGNNPIPPWEFRRVGKSQKTAAKPLQEADDSFEEDTKGSGGFSCGGKSRCGQMSSCAEARFYLQNCGARRLDRDGDGVPCESLCR
jgi:endonuclease YncB( thermonuclease family)